MRMQTRARGLKFASMTVIVVLTLTGFSTRSSGGTSSSGGSSGSSDGGSGGGCSSSSQDHDTSSSGGTSGLGKSDDYDDYDDYEDSYDDSYDDSATEDTGTGEEQLEPATVRLVTCASAKEPYATVEVTNPNAVDAEFWVEVSFLDKNGVLLEDGSWKVDVAAGDKSTARIEMAEETLAEATDHCEVEPEAEPTG
ncbi:hypothetical protein [Streptomyces capitiformicae]|uniref:Uncharacterized protein n=1 Tax=Streptomyces capitiformicae TaxID=2014920 RepID=A0A918Z5W3_9ACTN|nr:hypothetical protein [Streptomyces capitiformicae]GHE38831.1 hypothetical protein GCM10017771_57640 [Streptomyces capitiformicae]